MRIKDGVIMAGLQLPMWRVIVEASAVWDKYGHELVITSGLDGTHTPRSMHPFGYALDLRTNYFDSDETRRLVASDLQKKLGENYRVQFEGDHIHVHYRKAYEEAEAY